VSNGIDTSGIEMLEGEQTAITVAIVRPDGERAFVSDFSFQKIVDESIIQRHWARVEQAKYVCFLGLFCLPGFSFAKIASLMSTMQKLGKITLLDTGWDPAGWLPEHIEGINRLLEYTSIFIPNIDEARAISDCELPEDASEELRKRGVQTVIIKLGENGSYANSAGNAYRQPALPAEVYDAVGAGDVFNAGFLYALATGWDIRNCLIFGSAASAIYISRSENRFPAKEEVYNYAKQYYELPI
jgi:sugar/nucleoside kinase (ribokinase family)